MRRNQFFLANIRLSPLVPASGSKKGRSEWTQMQHYDTGGNDAQNNNTANIPKAKTEIHGLIWSSSILSCPGSKIIAFELWLSPHIYEDTCLWWKAHRVQALSCNQPLNNAAINHGDFGKPPNWKTCLVIATKLNWSASLFLSKEADLHLLLYMLLSQVMLLRAHLSCGPSAIKRCWQIQLAKLHKPGWGWKESSWQHWEWLRNWTCWVWCQDRESKDSIRTLTSSSIKAFKNK